MDNRRRQGATCGKPPMAMGKQRPGFTLVELLAVLVILSLLAAAAAVKYSQMLTVAEKASLQALMGAALSQCSIEHADLALNPEHSEFGLSLEGIAEQALLKLAYDTSKFETPVFTTTAAGITISVAFASGQGSATIPDKTWVMP